MGLFMHNKNDLRKNIVMGLFKRNKNDLLKDMEQPYSPQTFFFESDRRDLYYSALVKDIVKDNRTSQRLKCCFFIIVCVVFILASVGGMAVIWIIARKNNISLSDLGIAFTGFGSILSAIVVLPQIIAKHLFPENSEKVRFDFIKENQKSDQSYVEDDISGVENIEGSADANANSESQSDK